MKLLLFWCCSYLQVEIMFIDLLIDTDIRKYNKLHNWTFEFASTRAIIIPFNHLQGFWSPWYPIVWWLRFWNQKYTNLHNCIFFYSKSNKLLLHFKCNINSIVSWLRFWNQFIISLSSKIYQSSLLHFFYSKSNKLILQYCNFFFWKFLI